MTLEKHIEPTHIQLESAFNNACLSSAFNETCPGRPSETSIRELKRVRDSKNLWIGSYEQHLRVEIDRMLREHLHIIDGTK